MRAHGVRGPPRKAGQPQCPAVRVARRLAGMHLLAHLHPLQWAMALCALLAMLAGHLGPFAAYAVLKPLPLLLCLALVWRRADRHGQPVATRWLLAGLALSLLGDVCLLSGQGFLAGLAAFLLAHGCYIVLFHRGLPWLPHRPALLAVLACAALVYGYLATHGLPADMRLPVAAYVLVIAGMAAQAIGRAQVLRSAGARCVAWGALSFLVSDSILAIDRFVQPLPAATVWVLGSYYLAQGLIVHGMLQVLRVPQTK